MFPYLFVLIICFCLFLFDNSNLLLLKTKLRVLHCVFFVALALFLCFGYTTGSDWRTYEKMYEWSSVDLANMFLFVEPGYLIYTYIFSALNVDFFIFFIFTKLILFYIVIKTSRYYYPSQTFFLSFLFFLSWYGFFLFIDNPMRNFIAVCIFFCSLKFLRGREFCKYLIMTLIAMSFHFSAFIMLLIYYLYHKSLTNKMLILVFIALNIIFVSPRLIFFVAEQFFSNIPIVGNKIAAYAMGDAIDSDGKIVSFGLLVHSLIFMLLLMGRYKIEQYRNGKQIFNLAIIFPIFFRLGLTVTVVGRFQLYLTIFYVAAIGMLYYAFDRKSRILYLIFLLVICFGSCFTYLRSYKYVPYTNYLFMDKMSYDVRDTYNMEHTPYKAE